MNGLKPQEHGILVIDGGMTSCSGTPDDLNHSILGQIHQTYDLI